jgi:nitrite reductase (NO-forming)
MTFNPTHPEPIMDRIQPSSVAGPLAPPARSAVVVATAEPSAARATSALATKALATAALATAGLRILFGAVWAANAALKWFPAFGAGFLGMLTDVSQGQPAFLKPWFNLVTAVASDGRATILAAGAAGLETYLAVALLTGFARKTTYLIGAFYTAVLWATAEGFGGPYVPGTSTDVGAAIIYTLLFALLLVHDAGGGTSRLSVDAIIERRVPAWRRVAELGSRRGELDRGAVR